MTAYTNHTILAEPLKNGLLNFCKKWFLTWYQSSKNWTVVWKQKWKDPAVQIIDESGRVHMAHMDIHYGYSVNGVAALHTEILKNSELKAFYDLYPEKFNNKTNGITFRRWLMHANPRLSHYLDEIIGEGWHHEADRAWKTLVLWKTKQLSKKKLESIKGSQQT